MSTQEGLRRQDHQAVPNPALNMSNQADSNISDGLPRVKSPLGLLKTASNKFTEHISSQRQRFGEDTKTISKAVDATLPAVNKAARVGLAGAVLVGGMKIGELFDRPSAEASNANNQPKIGEQVKPTEQITLSSINVEATTDPNPGGAFASIMSDRSTGNQFFLAGGFDAQNNFRIRIKGQLPNVTAPYGVSAIAQSPDQQKVTLTGTNQEGWGILQTSHDGGNTFNASTLLGIPLGPGKITPNGEKMYAASYTYSSSNPSKKLRFVTQNLTTNGVNTIPVEGAEDYGGFTSLTDLVATTNITGTAIHKGFGLLGAYNGYFELQYEAGRVIAIHKNPQEGALSSLKQFTNAGGREILWGINHFSHDPDDFNQSLGSIVENVNGAYSQHIYPDKSRYPSDLTLFIDAVVPDIESGVGYLAVNGQNNTNGGRQVPFVEVFSLANAQDKTQRQLIPNDGDTPAEGFIKQLLIVKNNAGEKYLIRVMQVGSDAENSTDIFSQRDITNGVTTTEQWQTIPVEQPQPTPTATATKTATATATNTATPTATFTNTPEATSTAVATSSATFTPTPSETPKAGDTPQPTATATSRPPDTATATNTPTPDSTSTPSATPKSGDTPVPTPTATSRPPDTTATNTATRTSTPGATVSVTVSATPEFTPSPTGTATPTATRTGTPSNGEFTPTPTPDATATRTAVSSVTPTVPPSQNFQVNLPIVSRGRQGGS